MPENAAPMLSHAEAKRYYDRFGKKQDSQEFYEGKAVKALCDRADLEHATSVIEIGCGTGKLAAELLSDRLPDSARYLGLDVSSTMVELARARTAPFGERARIVQVDGSLPLPAADASADRFLATYVFDLLSEEEIAAMLSEAHRVLAPGGLLCVAGITPGPGGFSRFVSGVWTRIQHWRPMLVGGCRPLRLHEHLPEGQWRIVSCETVTAWGVASEVLVAATTGPDRRGDTIRE